MKKTFLYICLSFFIASLVSILAYLLFAVLEGKRINWPQTKKQQVMTKTVAQKILTGDYFIFSTITKQADTYRFSLWRYLVGTDNLDNFYNFDFSDLSNQPQVEKFSSESIAIHFKDSNLLLHLNGEIIGPAESFSALISPNRLWLAYVDPIDRSDIFVQDIRQQEQVAIFGQTDSPTNDLSVLQWSEDGQSIFLQKESVLYQFFPANFNLQMLCSLTEIKAQQIKIYPQLNIGLATSAVEDNSQLYLFTINSSNWRHILTTTKAKIDMPVLSPTGGQIAYNLIYPDLTSQVWLVDILHPQVTTKLELGLGRLLAWPEPDKLIIAKQNSLSLVETTGVNDQVLLWLEPSDLLSLSFIDQFKIK